MLDFLDPAQARRRSSFKLQPGKTAVLEWKSAGVRLNGRPWPSRLLMPSQAQIVGKLRFAAAPANDAEAFPMTRSKDALRDIVLKGEYR